MSAPRGGGQDTRRHLAKRRNHPLAERSQGSKGLTSLGGVSRGAEPLWPRPDPFRNPDAGWRGRSRPVGALRGSDVALREALPPGPFVEGGAAQGDSIPPRPRHERSARRGDRTPVAIWRNGGTIPLAERSQGSKGLTSLGGVSRGAEPLWPRPDPFRNPDAGWRGRSRPVGALRGSDAALREALPPGPFVEGGAAQGDSIPETPP